MTIQTGRYYQTSRFLLQCGNIPFLTTAYFILLFRGLLFRIDKESDDLLESVCRQLTSNIINQKGTTSTWYCALFCSKDHAAEFIRQLRKLIDAISNSMRRCLFARHSNRLSVLFTTLVVLTDSSYIGILFITVKNPIKLLQF